MRKRFVSGFAVGVVVLALVMGVKLFATNATPDPSSDAGVGVGSAFVIEPPMARYLRDLDQREQREQIRDWAVIATVVRLGATPAQAATATYELPPARLPYFDELYSFEYGRGRRAYLDKRVLLFRDGDDPDPQATIGRLADRVRMENGEIPSKVEIYLVHDQRDEGTILVERTADVAGSKLFSSAYGYVEGTADSVSKLSAWLGKTDDLAFARIDHGRVTLGGRRFSNTATANLTSEDVAALYQAHEQLDTPRAPARAVLASLPPRAREAAERLRMLVEAGASDEELHKADDALTMTFRRSDMSDARAIYDAVTALAGPAESPGFSLDPEWLPDPSSPQYPLMLSKLREFTADPCSALVDIAKRADTLERAEPDDTRRTASTRAALRIREKLSATVCPALQRILSPLSELISEVAAATPRAWESALVGYYQLIEMWKYLTSYDVSWLGGVWDIARGRVGMFDGAQRDAYRELAYLRHDPSAQLPPLLARGNNPLLEEPRALRESHDERSHAGQLAVLAMRFYEGASKAQCARYVGTAGTRVGITMFYTDLLAKIWESTDYASPLRSPMSRDFSRVRASI